MNKISIPETEYRLDRRVKKTPTEIWATIARIDELKGQWVAGARLSPQVLGRLDTYRYKNIGIKNNAHSSVVP